MLHSIIPSLQDRLKSSSENGKSRGFFEAAINLYGQLKEHRLEQRAPKTRADLASLRANLEKVNQLLVTVGNSQKRKQMGDSLAPPPSQPSKLASTAGPSSAATGARQHASRRAEVVEALNALNAAMLNKPSDKPADPPAAEGGVPPAPTAAPAPAGGSGGAGL